MSEVDLRLVAMGIAMEFAPAGSRFGDLLEAAERILAWLKGGSAPL